MKYHKDHFNWNKLKKILDEIEILLPFNEREIWWISFGINIGVEIDGKGDDFERPALIIRKLNKDHAWVIPLTRTEFPKYGIHLPIYHEALDTNSVAILTQLQTISCRRLLRRIGILPIDQFSLIIDSLIDIFPKTQKT